MTKELKEPWNDFFNFNYIRAIKAGWYFEDLANLQKAIEKNGKLSKGYFNKPENECFWAPIFNIPKSELRKIREDLVREFKIHSCVSSYRSDQTMRLLHTLTILHEPHSSIEKTFDEPMSYIRNSCISLWILDDGSEKNWNALIETAISISALAKKLVFKRELSEITEESVKTIFDSLYCLKDFPGYEESISSAYNDVLKAVELIKNPQKKRRKFSSK